MKTESQFFGLVTPISSKLLSRLALCWLAAAIFPAFGALPLESWSARDSGTTNTLYGVGYGASQFIAVGAAGTVLTSPDGESWVKRDAGTNDLFGVTHGGGKFVAVGARGTILSSINGNTWSPQTSGVSADLTRAGFGAGRFVAVGVAGSIVTSTNGQDWVVRQSNARAELTGVAYGNGTFLAVGTFCQFNGNPGSDIYSSADGETWSATTDFERRMFRSVAFGGDIFVIAANRPFIVPCDPFFGGPILTSRDGHTYETIDGGLSTIVHLDISHGNGAFVVAGVGPDGGGLRYSLDSSKWTSHFPSTTNVLWGVAYGAGTFVAVGEGGTILQSGLLVRLSTPRREESGALSFSISGRSSQDYDIEVSEDLMTWRKLTSLTNVPAQLLFVDPSAPTQSQRFYRAMTK